MQLSPSPDTAPATEPDGASENFSRALPFGPAVDLRPPHDRLWDISTDFWGIALRGNHVTSEKRFRLSLYTPFISWNAAFATALPNEQVVFAAGDNILLLDIPTMRIAPLARGYSPVVVVQNPALPNASMPAAP
jgi:hypothetical protein